MSIPTEERWLHDAIRLAVESVAAGGGPFGAVIVQNGRIIGRGQNRVTLDLDPTAHSEVVAIRDACRTLATFSLAGCEIYCSCEPCPMCLGAIYWARLERIVFAAARTDAAAAGFDDEFLYREMSVLPGARSVPTLQLLRGEGQAPFDAWHGRTDRTDY
jgi:tRNA(Arg) A34 adenosine deaminase TadA